MNIKNLLLETIILHYLPLLLTEEKLYFIPKIVVEAVVVDRNVLVKAFPLYKIDGSLLIGLFMLKILRLSVMIHVEDNLKGYL